MRFRLHLESLETRENPSDTVIGPQPVDPYAPPPPAPAEPAPAPAPVDPAPSDPIDPSK